MHTYVARYACIHFGEVSKITNYSEKLQHLGPRDHCLVSKHLMDNNHHRHLSSNCQLRNSVDYVVVGHQVSSSTGIAKELRSSCLPCIKILQ